jgi:hypothetical protein
VQRLAMPVDETIEWFTMRRDYPRQKVSRLQGSWSAGVEVAQTDIYTQGLLQIPTRQELQALWQSATPTTYQTPDYEALLSAGPTTLACRMTKPAWGDSQLIVIVNGSFLLNLPLVNHEHRKLAEHLIQQCGPGSSVAFLESGPGDPAVSNRASPPESSHATRERVLLAAHWCVLGLVYCFCIYPIFGRPKTIPDNTPSEFVQHVDALGELLQRTRDQQYAQRRLEYYHMITRRDPDTRQHPVGSTTGPRAGTDVEKPLLPKSDVEK